MRLDKVNDVPKAPGFARSLREDDLYFMPYWERIFGKECRVESYDILTTVNKLKQNMKTGLYYIWEDGFPVSTASNRRNTENGAVVNFVYTPPHYRSKGYASSVVAELSQALLNRGNKFCCLFADTENPISCGIYRKIGYYDLCVVDVIKFDKGERDNVQ
jgi:predicted GNAT family acetyltransferase